MSLILEALKKSEEQRRLGEMPNLGTPITATRRRRSPLPWLAAVAVIAIAAVGGWRFLRHPPASAPAASQAAQTKVAAKPDIVAVPAPVAPRQPTRPTALPPPVPQAAAPTPVPAQAAPAPKKEIPPPVAPPAPPPAAAAAPASAPTSAPVPAPPAATTTPAAAPAPAPPVNDVPTVDELPPDVRSALPELPITMQVYSADPKRRFVIIEGTRVLEGESLRGVTVQEIRPAGLVLEFHGRRVLLPRPGS